MEKFIVSARKYRPQDFASVVGQQHITTTLKNAILHNTLAHAFLFCGPRGVGKTTCARILAKTINCENLQTDGEACNTCTSCQSFNNGTSLNIHELDAASNNSVDDIRDLVTQVRYAPQQGKYRIYIIDEVHMLSTSAFNAFLKTLEEPPSYAKFILATTEKHKILPTILSRCQIFDFKRITTADTVHHLQEIAGKEHIEADKASLQLIAQKSEGCMRDSLSLLDKIVSFSGGKLNYAHTLEHLNLLDEDYLFRLLEALHTQDMATALLLFDEILAKGFEGDTVLGGLAECLRNLMVCKDERAARLLDVVEGMQQRYVDTASGLSMSFMVSALNLVAEAEIQYKMARNKRLLVEMALIKICYLSQAIEMATDAETGKVMVKKRAIDGPVAVRTKAITREAPAAAKAASLNVKTTAAAAAVKTVEHQAQQSEKTATASTVQAPMPKAAIRQPLPPPPPELVDEAQPRQSNILQKLKAKREQQNGEDVHRPALPIDWSEVLQLWEEMAALQLKADQHSVSNAMRRARLQQAEQHLIEIASITGTDLRMIQGVSTDFLDQLKKRYANNDIKLQLIQIAGDEAPKELAIQHLPARERFQQMATDYPMVEELRRRLNLDIQR